MKPRQPRYSQIFGDDEEKAETAKEVWREVVDDLISRGALTPIRVKIADRYARSVAEYVSLYPVAVAEGPVKVGPNGGDVFNFKWSAVEKLNDRMAKFEDQLRVDLRHSDVGDAPPGVTKKTKADDYLRE
ncbi:MAG: P27 family phage terminase small subunit [Parvularcula sp.]|jgi:hypothetical protein|nr:P27 family phage terminase small subunit [Parvularcula sp.]